MTAQIQDVFHYRNQPYALAGISEGELFDVASLGVAPVPSCSACWRGYQAEYALRDGRLVLASLHLSLEGCGPTLHGVKPSRVKAERYDFFNNHYEGLDLPIAYSGGVLLADGFLRALYVHMGFHPAWKYERVIELVFDEGRLTGEHDRSERMAELRERFTRTEEVEASPKQMPTREEIREFVERCFDRRYRM